MFELSLSVFIWEYALQGWSFQLVGHAWHRAHRWVVITFSLEKDEFLSLPRPTRPCRERPVVCYISTKLCNHHMHFCQCRFLSEPLNSLLFLFQNWSKSFILSRWCLLFLIGESSQVRLADGFVDLLQMMISTLYIRSFYPEVPSFIWGTPSIPNNYIPPRACWEPKTKASREVGHCLLTSALIARWRLTQCRQENDLPLDVWLLYFTLYFISFYFSSEAKQLIDQIWQKDFVSKVRFGHRWYPRP